jgi:hypothetical protein
MSEQDDFTAAQDKANRAYDETLRRTGRGTDASAEYQSTMSAEYYNKITIKPRRVVMVSTPTRTEIDADWMAGVWPTLTEIAY